MFDPKPLVLALAPSKQVNTDESALEGGPSRRNMRRIMRIRRIRIGGR